MSEERDAFFKAKKMEAKTVLLSFLGGSGRGGRGVPADVDEDTVEYLLGLVSTVDLGDEEALQDCCGVFLEYKRELSEAEGATRHARVASCKSHRAGETTRLCQISGG